MSDVNQVIDLIMEELRRDALLKDDDPFKMPVYMRNDYFKKLFELQRQRLNISKTSKILHAKREERAEARGQVLRPVGRPRKDLYPDSPSKEFLRELDKRTKAHGEEVDRQGDQAPGTNYADGEAAGNLEVGSGE